MRVCRPRPKASIRACSSRLLSEWRGQPIDRAEAGIGAAWRSQRCLCGQDGRVTLRQVRPGRTEGDVVEILAGLEPGEQVALDPIRAGVYLKEQLQRTAEK